MNTFKFNNCLIKPFYGDLPNPDNPTVAYHYTSPNAFLSIIKDGFIRFSDIEYMNDKSELVYVYKVLIDFLKEHKDQYSFTWRVLNELIGAENYSEIQSLRATHILYKELPNLPIVSSRMFLFCLAMERDSLNMWNYYVQSGNYEGYNIGLDIYKFLSTFETPEQFTADPFVVRYGQIIYEKQQQLQYIKAEVDKIERLQKDKTVDLAACTLRMDLQRLGLFMKHPCFKIEHELRIVIEFSENKIPHGIDGAKKYFGPNNHEITEDFCIKNGILVPFLKVRLPQESIVDVTVSPIMEYDLAQKSIAELLNIKQYPHINIKQSEIPIRY